jgi:hypothetical protein
MPKSFYPEIHVGQNVDLAFNLPIAGKHRHLCALEAPGFVFVEVTASHA